MLERTREASPVQSGPFDGGGAGLPVMWLDESAERAAFCSSCLSLLVCHCFSRILLPWTDTRRRSRLATPTAQLSQLSSVGGGGGLRLHTRE